MSQTAGPAINAENSVGFSGVGKANFMVTYGSEKGIAVAQSGAQSIQGSGAGILISVIGLTGLLSGGGGAANSQSGCTITVYDAVSGATINYQSGASIYGANTAGILYQFNYGTASGLGTGGLNIAPPDLTQINAIYKSGLIACISGGVVGTVGIELIYAKGF